MTRRRAKHRSRPRAAEPRGAAQPPTPRAPWTRRMWPWAVVVMGVLVASVLWMRGRGGSGRGADAAALADSAAAAHDRRDWLGAMHWGTLLVARSPRDAAALCDLALAIHNVALARTAAPGGAKPPLRNSLERTRYDRLAIALMDSSRACARRLDDWARAERYLGNFYEILGLPLEALERYETILERAPSDSVALARRYWVATHLMDPRATDFPVFESHTDPLPHRARRSRGR